MPRIPAQQWTECSELGAQSMHANGGHDQLDGLRLNACIAWKSCQHKIWTGLSSTGPWPSATCTGHAGSSFLGHVNTYHRTSPCALSWCSACMSKTLVRVATHKLCCCWLIDRSEVCLLCAGRPNLIQIWHWQLLQAMHALRRSSSSRSTIMPTVLACMWTERRVRSTPSTAVHERVWELSVANYIVTDAVTWRAWHGRRRREKMDGADEKCSFVS